MEEAYSLNETDIADQENVYVAARLLRASRDRTEDNRYLHPACDRY